MKNFDTKKCAEKKPEKNPLFSGGSKMARNTPKIGTFWPQKGYFFHPPFFPEIPLFCTKKHPKNGQKIDKFIEKNAKKWKKMKKLSYKIDKKRQKTEKLKKTRFFKNPQKRGIPGPGPCFYHFYRFYRFLQKTRNFR